MERRLGLVVTSRAESVHSLSRSQGIKGAKEGDIESGKTPAEVSSVLDTGTGTMGMVMHGYGTGTDAHC